MSSLFTRRAMAALLALPALFTARKAGAQEALLSVLGDRRAAAKVGGMALAAWPDMRDADRLTAQILGGIAPPDGHDASALRGRLAAIIRDDFAAGRTVKLDGWLLAQTEARLCALAALKG